MFKPIEPTSCQIALARGIALNKIGAEWRSQCPVCKHATGMIYDKQGGFRCDSCGIHGNGKLLDYLFYRAESMEG